MGVSILIISGRKPRRSAVQTRELPAKRELPSPGMNASPELRSDKGRTEAEEITPLEARSPGRFSEDERGLSEENHAPQGVAAVIFLAIFLLPLFTNAQGFNKNLYFGMRNNSEVVRLQEFLRDLGYFTYPTSTGNYFTATLNAVKKFQKDNGIPAIGGYFGPQSRTIANRLLSPVEEATSSATKTVKTKTSPYKGKIVISFVSGKSEDPKAEYLILANKTEKEKVIISDWFIEISSGARFTIPKGYELPGFSTLPSDPIALRPGDRATITVGRQEKNADFRQNVCTGYFDEETVYSPTLSHQCPRPDTGRLISLSDQCLRIIDATPTCRLSRPGPYIDSDCSQYLNRSLNYTGCVADYRNRKDFYSQEWLIWMQKNQEFFRNVREHIILRDPQGRVVDEYSY
ncbi:MAG: peptidoglycan-binding protein [Candidatus Sungiibacteriota bacterium]|uniref:Peptidoglycan-binding protein n=1 Tax=Candidatus Sungiibacteriota bacterium TaxID=2750080 RepID=A0A7T5UR37_9BACT|nr:MAG: peptidoglycan-binding protein [Candidatus Sungbacteria bacterium]